MSFKKKQEPILDQIDLALVIDSQNLNEELMNQPLAFRKWTKLKSEVTARAKTLDEYFKRVKAARRMAIAKGGSFKVKDLDAEVELDDEVRRAKADLIEAERLQEEYEGIVRAFWQRHEVIKELAANVRKEIVQ